MGLDINKSDLLRLLEDDKFIDEVVKKVVEDPEVLKRITKELVDEIGN